MAHPIVQSHLLAEPQNVLTRRLIFYRGRMDRDPEPARACSILELGASAGYNGFLFQSRYYDKDYVTRAYRTGFAALKAKADQSGVKLIPMTFHEGHPTPEDTTVAEALPAKGTRFVVANGEARVVPDTLVTIEEALYKWRGRHGYIPGKTAFVDSAVKHSGDASLRVENPGAAMVDCYTSVKLKRFRAYELSVWIKTASYTGNLKVGILISQGKRSLLKRRDRTFMTPANWAGVKPSQNWTKHVIDFNSLDAPNPAVIFVASDGKATGKIWIDEIKIREVGLYETIRRETTPVTVKQPWPGTTTYKEGTDYVVEAEKLTIPAGSAIKNGDTLRVDWFQYGNIETMYPAASFCHQRPWDIYLDQTKYIDALFGRAQAWHIEYDEWRVSFWDPGCLETYRNDGEYKGGTTRKAENLLRSINSNMEIYVWGGVYDPYHQGTHQYYACNSSSRGAWTGLGDSTVVFSWNGGGKKQALRFFAGQDTAYPSQTRQFRQGFCVWGSSYSASQWLAEMEAAEADGVRNIMGMQYMSWATGSDGKSGNYDDLVATANIFKKAGRWGNGPIDLPPPAVLPSSRSVDNADIGLSAQVNTGILQIRCRLPEKWSPKLTLLNVRGQSIWIRRLSGSGSYPMRIRSDVSHLAGGVYVLRLSASHAGKTASRSLRIVVL